MSDTTELAARLSKVERALFGDPQFSKHSENVAKSVPVCRTGLLALVDKLELRVKELEEATGLEEEGAQESP